MLQMISLYLFYDACIGVSLIKILTIKMSLIVKLL